MGKYRVSYRSNVKATSGSRLFDTLKQAHQFAESMKGMFYTVELEFIHLH